MKKLKMSKSSAVLFAEALIAFVLVLKCFESCASYTLDKDDFNQCYVGDLREFHDGYVGIQEQGIEEVDIIDYSLRLKSGAYSVKVLYESFSDYYTIDTDNCAGRISIDTDGSADLKMSDMRLRDGLNEIDSRFWITNGKGDSEVRIHVIYHGKGILAVKSIQIEEKREYRILTCVAVICLMVVCNLIYVYFIKKDNTFSRQKERIIVAVIGGITAFSSVVYFADYIYMGHDMAFHFARIISLANALKEYQIPHRMQFEMLNGYGYAAPLFYGEAFLLLPAVLYNLYLPVQTCYQIFVVLVNLLTGVISYWCFMRMSEDWKKGLIGAFIYTLAAYRLTNVIVRGAVGEYTAQVFFPLLIYGFWRVYGKEKDEKILIKDYICIILAATGIVNTHILSCEMVLLFVILFVLINYKKTFRKNILAVLIKCVAFSFLLNMWFVIPFISSMGMRVNVSNREDIYAIEGNVAYLSQLLGVFHTASGGNVSWSAQNEMPLSIGMSIIIGIGLFVYVYIKKEEWDLHCNSKMWGIIECFTLGLTALFFSSNFCEWDSLRYINRELARYAGMVQFPWRYLGIAIVILTTMIVFLLQILEEHISTSAYRMIVLAMIAAVVITEGHFIMEYVDQQHGEKIYSESDVGSNIARGEYLLQGTGLYEYKGGRAIITSGENIECATFYYDSNGRYYLTCNNRQDTQGYIDVPIYAYDNYHAYKEDGEELSTEMGESNRIRVYIPGGYVGVICIKYVVPILWRVCEIISFITMCVLIIAIARIRLKNR